MEGARQAGGDAISLELLVMSVPRAFNGLKLWEASDGYSAGFIANIDKVLPTKPKKEKRKRRVT
jgi:hypothetical protein